MEPATAANNRVHLACIVCSICRDCHRSASIMATVASLEALYAVLLADAPPAPAAPHPQRSTVLVREGETEPDPEGMRWAAEEGDLRAVAAQLAVGVEAGAEDEDGETALIYAAEEGHVNVGKLLLKSGAEVDAPNGTGTTALTYAASCGHLAFVQMLVAHGADKHAKRDTGKTAADFAMEANHPAVFAFLDPQGARRMGLEIRRDLAAATTVHVISSRGRRHKSHLDEKTCDPAASAAQVKALLDKGEGIVAFDPHGANALLKALSSAEPPPPLPRRRWDTPPQQPDPPHDDHTLGRRHWQMAMARAKETGGRLVQIIVPGGLSPVQQAEADLAEALGIEVVRLDCTQCEGCVSEAEARADGDGGLVGAHGLRQVLKKAMEHGGRRREMDGASRDRRRAARVVEL